MTQFASKTPRDLNHDPKPYRGKTMGTRATSELIAKVNYPEHWEHDPRPEFDHVQHNEPNPILVAFRVDKDNGPVGYVVGGRRPSRIEHWLAQIAPFDRTAVAIGTGVQPSVAQIDHARQVLTKLAAQEALEA